MFRFLLRKCTTCWLLLVALLAVHSSYAWGVTGHRVIAEIAQRHLSSKAKKELYKLIGKETLAMWANWPDFIRSDSSWNRAAVWHYINVPGNLSKDAFLTNLKNLKGENLYSQIPAMVAELKNKSLPIEKRQIALRFLIHLVGDLHQPLHVGREDDRGGNRITVYWFDKKTNLHSLWDNDLVDFQQYSYTEYANVLDIANASQVLAWQKSSLEEWFSESYILANRVYELSPPESKLSFRYNFIFQSTIDSQLLKGGVRLAELLNQALK